MLAKKKTHPDSMTEAVNKFENQIRKAEIKLGLSW
jgi:hypothetical protein